RTSDGLDERECASLFEAYAYACYLSGQGDSAIQARLEAIELWRKLGDQMKEGENLRWLSRIYWFQGQNAEAQRAGAAAMELLERLPPGPQLAMAYSNMSQLKMLTWEVPDAIAWGNRAIALAETLNERETLIHALTNVGTARGISGDLDGFAQLEQARLLAVEDGYIDHAGRAATNLAWTHL